MKSRKNWIAALATVLFSIVLFILYAPIIGVPAAALIVGAGLFTAFKFNPGNVLGLNNTNNVSARQDYKNAQQLLFNSFMNDPAFKGNANACWDWVNSRKLSQSEVRLEVQLNTANNIFTFGVTPNQQNTNNVIFNTEQRLLMQDTLIANEYGIFVGNPASATDTAWEAKTYGNNQVFSAGASAALNSTFFSNGNFKITCNNDVVLPYRGLFNHWYRPQTQQTAALGAGSPMDQIRGAEDGIITLEPSILLIGSKNYQPQIVLPSNLATVDSFERVVLIFRGILAQNSTSVS